MASSFELPADAFETGFVTVLAEDEFHARQAVHEYEAIRNICRAKQTQMLLERLTYLVAAIPLVLNDLQPLLDRSPLSVLFWASLALYLFAAVCVLLLKNMLLPAFSLPFFVLESLFRADISHMMFTVILPLVSLGILTVLHERAKRYVRSQQGYPDFRSVEVRVLREEMSSERHVPLPMPQEKDPYADVLSALPAEADRPQPQHSSDDRVPPPGEPEADPYADILSDLQ